MILPVVTKEICASVSNEIKRGGINYLTTAIDSLKEEQSCLFGMIGAILERYEATHGITAAEAMLRVLVIMYKLIEAQFDVNELEEQAKL